MKFNDMPYARPDGEAVKQKLGALTEQLKNAVDYAQAKATFMEFEQETKRYSTMATLTSVRHSIDTRDKFYDDEETTSTPSCRNTCRPGPWLCCSPLTAPILQRNSVN